MSAPLVVLGAGGKLGRLLSGVWPPGTRAYARQDLDINDKGNLEAALSGASAVLCLAGVTNGSDGPMSLNTSLARAVLDSAQGVGSGRVFLMSSAAVYGRQSGTLSEDTTPRPISPYGQAKVDMERMAAAHAHPNVTLRLGNVAGADAILGGWQPGFALDTLASGHTPRRSYIGLLSLVRVFETLATAPDVPRLINVAAPGAIEMGALLDAADLAWRPRPATDTTIPEVTLDTARLLSVLDWPPEATTAKGMVYEWKKVTGRR